jgi:hypothetical protein
MSKKQRVILSIGAMIGGWLLCAFAMTTGLRQPVPTIGIVFGLALSVSAFISLIIALKKPAVQEEVEESKE